MSADACPWEPVENADRVDDESAKTLWRRHRRHTMVIAGIEVNLDALAYEIPPAGKLVVWNTDALRFGGPT